MTLTDKEYRAIQAESYSGLKYLLDSPLEYIRNKETPFKGNASTDLGTALHHYLQGNRHLVAINPFPQKRGKDYEEYEKEFLEQHPEGIIVPKSAEVKINAIMANFNANDIAIQLIEGAEVEKPIFFEYNGVKCKGKLDWAKKTSTVDGKSTGNCDSAEMFSMNCVDGKHYDLQAAMYTLGQGFTVSDFEKGHVGYYFIALLTVPPYSVNAYELSRASFLRGVNKLNKVTEAYKRYIVDKEPWTPKPTLEEV